MSEITPEWPSPPATPIPAPVYTPATPEVAWDRPVPTSRAYREQGAIAMTSPFDATIRAAPLDGPLYAQCACQRTHQLKASGAWALCKCGRAIRFVGELQLLESAEEWERQFSRADSQLADAQAAAVRAGKRETT